MREKQTNIRWLLIALVLCLAGAVGEKVFESNWGHTEKKELHIVSESGYSLAMNAFIPDNAGPETKAPAVVVVHGGNDDKDLMTRYAMELARRGYVAVAIDMYGHGDSQELPDSQWLTAGRGTYDAVKEVAGWPFVDTDQISLMGYSRGGKACGEALEMDNETLNVVKNIYLLYSDPIYKNSEGFTDVYGARNVAVIADLYDEFFFTEKADNTGVYSNDTNRFMATLTSPVDYLSTPSAQSFLYFGEDPAGKELRADGVVYEKDYGQKTGSRSIRMINQDHMSGHYSAACLNDMLDFFQRVVPSPLGVTSGAGLWAGYDFFAFVGMTGLIMFLIYSAAVIAEHSRFFGDLVLGKPEIAVIDRKQDRIWHWCGVAAGILFTIFIIWGVNKLKLSSWHDTVLRSARFVYVPVICGLGAVFTLVVSTVTCYKQRKKEPESVNEAMGRVMIGWKKVLKSALLAAILITMFYIIVFGAKYFLGITYKFTLWGFQTFSAKRLKHVILVLPMLTLFYVVAAMNNDGLGYTSILGKNRTVNAVLASFLGALPMLAVMVYFYGSFRITGWNPMFGGNAAAGASVYTLPMIVFVMVLLCRKIFEKTGNLYLGGFIAGFLTSVMTCSVCEIRIPEPGEPFTISWLILGFVLFAYGVLAACMLYFRQCLRERKD